MKPRTQTAMGPWEACVHEYLAFRRGLGFSLRSVGDELILFARHLESIGHRGPLTAAAAIQWAQSPSKASPRYWAIRLAAVRPFAQYLAAADPRHEVPAAGIFGRRPPRAEPHIYSSAELRDLLAITRIVKPVDQLPPHTFRTFFGLLAATGIRCGEALNLKRAHVDLVAGRLLIVKGKFGKSRLVPLHPSATKALSDYAARRDRAFPRGPKSDAFFLSRRATALSYQRVTKTFRDLRRELGWRTKPVPRVHDLRHTFAVTNLIRWSEDGADVDNKIAALATYLGHVNVTSTYWYFSAVPELMAIAGRRFEAHARRTG